MTEAEKAFWQRNLMYWTEHSEQERPKPADPLPELTAEVLRIAKSHRP